MPTDAVFLLGESREHPMHVGGLQLYEPPPDAGPGFVRDFHDQLVAQQEFQPTFLKRPATFLGGIGSLGWAYDKDVDIDYHVRRSALPSPGRVRDLLELTSLLHSGLLDRHRPLWEAQVIEGLNDGRFAVYTKMHHALIDGVSALKLMQRALSNDPNDTEVRAPWMSGQTHSGKTQLVVPVEFTAAYRRICCGTGSFDSVAGSRGVVRAAVDAALRGPTHHVERQDRWRPTVCGAVVVAGSHQKRQEGRGGDPQRCCLGDVFGSPALLPA